MEIPQRDKKPNPLTRFRKWLFAKRERWIPTVIVLVLVILPFIALGIFVLYRYIDLTLDDIRYQKDEKARVEQLQIDLKENQERWLFSEISNYKFNLDLYFGGYEMWEGFGGYSSGADEVRSLTIEVNQNNTIEIFSNDLNEPLLSTEYEYCDSIPDLFLLIEDTLNEINNPAVDLDTYSVENSPVIDYTTNQILVDGEFNEEYGYPELITIYEFFGNWEYYDKYYIVCFEITKFIVLS